MSASCGVYAVLGGALTLAGWFLGIERLTSWIGDNIAMFPNTAVAAVASGLALVVLASRIPARRALARVAGCFVGLIGGLTLLQHVAGLDLGIDTLLSRASWGQRAAAAPMRMGPPASASYVLLGIGLVCAAGGARARRFASSLAIVPVVIASLSLIGFWYGVDRLFGVARVTGIALQTSTIVFSLGVGLLASVPEHGLVALMRRPDAGGILARRLLLPIVAVPVVLGKLTIAGELAGLFGTAFGIALLVLATVAMLMGLLWWTASGVSRQARIALAAARAVRESEARLQSILGQLPIGVGVVDPGGDWTLTNRLMDLYVPRAILSSSAGRDPRLRAWDERGDPLPPERWPARRALGGERVVPGVEMLYTADDGRETWVRFSAAPLYDEAGTIVGATCIVQDIDLSKRFQDQLQEQLARRTQEVRQAAQSLALAQRLTAVGTMAAGLAHDIDNITFPLAARLDVVLRSPALDEKIKRELTVITALIDHLRQMSRNLSLFSRDPEQEGAEGTTELSAWSERVRALLEASLAGAGGRQSDTYVRLRFEIPAGLPPVRVAPHRLTQAILNVVHNARDAVLAAREQGMLTSRAERGRVTVQAKLREHPAAVLLSIIDDGCGMDEQTRRRAIEPFFTTKHRPVAAGSPGSGLGLALAHAICQRVGGSLEIRSEIGQGTAVTLTLPIETRPEPDPAPTPVIRVMPPQGAQRGARPGE